MCTVAVGKDVAAVAERAMSRARHANREPLHPPREGLLVRGLDDQVKVIGLHREMHDTKVVFLARSD